MTKVEKLSVQMPNSRWRDVYVGETWLVRFKAATALTEVLVVRVFSCAVELNPVDERSWVGRGIFEVPDDVTFVEQVTENPPLLVDQQTEDWRIAIVDVIRGGKDNLT
jgi:hypothetical protein